MLNIGTNDIAAGRSGPEVVDGLVRFATLARAAGKRVFLTTITPSDAGPHGTAHAAAARDEMNRWVRERGPEHADGVFDFAAAVADPVRPTRLRDRYDSGDGLHLSEAGYRALANAVDSPGSAEARAWPTAVPRGSRSPTTDAYCRPSRRSALRQAGVSTSTAIGSGPPPRA